MATVRAPKRSAFSSEDSSLSDTASTREEEKTIPFLRRLSDMLLENEDVISFYPGNRNSARVVLGRIVVHDRHKVESDVLPRYFNHASFASLRRQLNYFNFTRMGKGRQRGATYSNEAVIELSDILRLKRKSVTQCVPADPHSKRSCKDNSDNSALGNLSYVKSEVPFVHLASTREEDHGRFNSRRKKRKLSANDVSTLPAPHLSPTPQAVSDDDTPTVIPVPSLDLTAGTSSFLVLETTVPNLPEEFQPSVARDTLHDHLDAEVCRDRDMLAGCCVLLSFCKAKTAFT